MQNMSVKPPMATVPSAPAPPEAAAPPPAGQPASAVPPPPTGTEAPSGPPPAAAPAAEAPRLGLGALLKAAVDGTYVDLQKASIRHTGGPLGLDATVGVLTALSAPNDKGKLVLPELSAPQIDATIAALAAS